MGVLRWRSVLDDTIAHFSFTPFRKLDLEVLTALRMGVYQKQFLSKIPAHASVNETVELVKQAKKVSATGLVNAVMRKVKSAAYDPHASTLTGMAYLFSALAHPKWLVERWVKDLGEASTKLICEYDQRVPATVLRLSSPEDEAMLAQHGIQLAPGVLMKNARVVTGGELSATLLSDNKIAIQDEGSQLSRRTRRRWQTHSRLLRRSRRQDRRDGHAAALRLKSSPLSCIRIAQLYCVSSRRNPTSKSSPPTRSTLPYGPDFDRVLADVPCSGTGTLARNPEIKWKLKPEDLRRSANAPDRHSSRGHGPCGSRRTAGLFHLFTGTGRERTSNCCLPARRARLPDHSDESKNWLDCKNRVTWSGRISISWSAAIFCGRSRAFIHAMDFSLRFWKRTNPKDYHEGSQRERFWIFGGMSWCRIKYSSRFFLCVPLCPLW